MRGRTAVLRVVVLACALATAGCAKVAADPLPSPSPSTKKPVKRLSWDQVRAMAARGLVRVDAVGCASTHGNGILVEKGGYVLTTLDTVGDASRVSVRSGSQALPGKVVGLAPDRGQALIELSGRFDHGYVFNLATGDVRTKTRIAVFGTHGADDLTLSFGRVTTTKDDLLVTRLDLGGPVAAGSPVLTQDAAVVGLVRSSRTGAKGNAEPSSLTSTYARAVVKDRGSLPKVSEPACPPRSLDRSSTKAAAEPDAAVAAHLLQRYADGLNARRYQESYALLSPQARADVSRARFTQVVSGRNWNEFHIGKVTPVSPTQDRVEVSFVTFASPGTGCLNWSAQVPISWKGSGDWQLGAVPERAGRSKTC